MGTWTPEQVTFRLSSIGRIGEANKKVWESLRVDGETLGRVTQEALEKRGMEFGPALKVVSEIRELLGQPLVAVPSSTYSIFS